MPECGYPMRGAVFGEQLPERALLQDVVQGEGKTRVDTGWISFERRSTVSRSILAEEGESSPYNHHVQHFLTFLKQERGFADATIVNRARSLKPFLAWLVAKDMQLSAVSPV
jgi:hypothetical protein